jgi:hypothetical protein
MGVLPQEATSEKKAIYAKFAEFFFLRSSL